MRIEKEVFRPTYSFVIVLSCLLLLSRKIEEKERRQPGTVESGAFWCRRHVRSPKRTNFCILRRPTMYYIVQKSCPIFVKTGFQS